MSDKPVLSEADFEQLVGVPWRPGESLRTRMTAAFQLGIERGKAEREKYQFICDRCGIRQNDKYPTGENPF